MEGTAPLLSNLLPSHSSLPPFLYPSSDAPPPTRSPSHFLPAGNPSREAFVSFLGKPATSIPHKVEKMGSTLLEGRHLGAKKSRTCSGPGKMENFSPFSTSRDGDGVVEFSLQRRRRSRTKAVANDENAEKPSSRKRNSKGRCKEEPRTTVLPDSLTPKGMQELDAKTLDLSRYASDLPLERLMSGHHAISRKQEDSRIAVKDNSLGMHVSSILQNLCQPFQAGMPASSKAMPKSVDNKNQNIALDLEFPPPTPSVNEEKVKISSSPSNVMIRESSNVQEVSAVQFPLLAHPIIPHEEFMRKLQLPACDSIDALIRQAGEPFGNKIISNEKSRRPHMNANNMSTSVQYGQTGYQDIQSDAFANSKMNHWYRAEPLKRDYMNDDHLPSSSGHKFPYSAVPESNDRKVEVKRGMERTVRLDIDLNKQLPDLDSAETMLETHENILDAGSLVFSKPDNGKDSSMSVQSCSDTLKEQHPSTALPVGQVPIDVPLASEVVLSSPSTDLIMPKCTSVLENDAVSKQGSQSMSPNDIDKYVAAPPMNETEKLEFGAVSERVRENCEATQAASQSSFTMSSLPSCQKTDDVLHDVPFSPRVQAAARILWGMARSSGPLYIEDGHKAKGFQIEVLTHQSAKVAEGISSREMGMKTSEEKKSQNKQQICKIPMKAQGKEGKERVLSNNKGSSLIPMKRKTDGLVASHERWAFASPKAAPRNPKPANLSFESDNKGSPRNPKPANPSFESDKMHAPPLKENSVSDLYGKGNRVRLDQQSTGVSSKLSVLPCSRKEGNVVHAIESGTNVRFTSPVKAPAFLQRKSDKTCEAKPLLTQKSGSPKISRPRSNLSKSCFSSQKPSNSFSMKPGLTVKAQRPAHPYVEEIRYGSN